MSAQQAKMAALTMQQELIDLDIDCEIHTQAVVKNGVTIETISMVLDLGENLFAKFVITVEGECIASGMGSSILCQALKTKERWMFDGVPERIKKVLPSLKLYIKGTTAVLSHARIGSKLSRLPKAK